MNYVIEVTLPSGSKMFVSENKNSLALVPMEDLTFATTFTTRERAEWYLKVLKALDPSENEWGQKLSDLMQVVRVLK